MAGASGALIRNNSYYNITPRGEIEASKYRLLDVSHRTLRLGHILRLDRGQNRDPRFRDDGEADINATEVCESVLTRR